MDYLLQDWMSVPLWSFGSERTSLTQSQPQEAVSAFPRIHSRSYNSSFQHTTQSRHTPIYSSVLEHTVKQRANLSKVYTSTRTCAFLSEAINLKTKRKLLLPTQRTFNSNRWIETEWSSELSVFFFLWEALEKFWSNTFFVLNSKTAKKTTSQHHRYKF